MPIYPVSSVEVVNGAVDSNTRKVDVSTAGAWVPGIQVIMQRRKLGDDTGWTGDKFRFQMAVSVTVGGLLGPDEKYVGLGIINVEPILQGVELVAVAHFPDLYNRVGEPPVTLKTYEFCFTSDPDVNMLRANVWLVPLFVVPSCYEIGVTNVQTRRGVPGDFVRRSRGL